MKNTELAETVVKQLIRAGKTVAVAESLTGGGLGAAITEIAGSSEVFLGGITTYSDASKTKLLDVPKKTNYKTYGGLRRSRKRNGNQRPQLI